MGGHQIKTIELGERDPTLSTVMRLVSALQLTTLDELLGPTKLQELYRAAPPAEDPAAEN